MCIIKKIKKRKILKNVVKQREYFPQGFCTTWAYVRKVAISYQQMAIFPIDGVRIFLFVCLNCLNCAPLTMTKKNKIKKINQLTSAIQRSDFELHEKMSFRCNFKSWRVLCIKENANEITNFEPHKNQRHRAMVSALNVKVFRKATTSS